MSHTYTSIRLYTDGGARGNPGPAGAGAVLKTIQEDGTDGDIIGTVSRYLGETTNNQAEYYALIFALEKAKDLGAKTVDAILDSELIVKQLQGTYKVKHPEIMKRFLEVQHLLRQFDSVSFRHVLRAKNKEADRLVNEAIDKRL